MVGAVRARRRPGRRTQRSTRSGPSSGAARTLQAIASFGPLHNHGAGVGRSRRRVAVAAQLKSASPFARRSAAGGVAPDALLGRMGSVLLPHTSPRPLDARLAGGLQQRFASSADPRQGRSLGRSCSRPQTAGSRCTSHRPSVGARAREALDGTRAQKVASFEHAWRRTHLLWRNCCTSGTKGVSPRRHPEGDTRRETPGRGWPPRRRPLLRAGGAGRPDAGRLRLLFGSAAAGRTRTLNRTSVASLSGAMRS